MEVLGTCCGKPGTGDCGGYSGGKSALEHYKDGLFDEPKVTTWKSECFIDMYFRKTQQTFIQEAAMKKFTG